MTRWYTTREAVKAAVGVDGNQNNALIDSCISQASAAIDSLLSPIIFIPKTEIRYYPWPQYPFGIAIGRFPAGLVLRLDQELLAVTLLQAKAQDTSPVTIPAADYFLEPVNQPPYMRIEINISSTSSFQAGKTPQRSIAVTGRWGHAETTRAAGALAAAVDGSATALAVTDASLIDVGDTVLIGTEALFVSDRSPLDTTATLNDTLTATANDVTVTISDATKVKQNEVIQVDSEKMLVESITGNDLTVRRAYDGSVLAAHSGAVKVYAFRTLTVERAVNGTTAAAHPNATAISKYVPPLDISRLCLAEAIATLKQGESGWSGQIGGGGGAVATPMFNLRALEEEALRNYGWVTV